MKPNLDSIRSESDRIGSQVVFSGLEGSRAFIPCRYGGATAGGLGESLDGRQGGILDSMERRFLSGLSARCGGLRRTTSMACWSLPRRLCRSTARARLRLRSRRQKQCVGNTNGHLAQLQTSKTIPQIVCPPEWTRTGAHTDLHRPFVAGLRPGAYGKHHQVKPWGLEGEAGAFAGALSRTATGLALAQIQYHASKRSLWETGLEPGELRPEPRPDETSPGLDPV